MRIAVTGATSFIGRPLIKRLTEDGHECIAVVRRGGLIEHDCFPMIQVVEMDMSEYSNMHHETGNIDCLINLAWIGTRGIDRMDHDMQKANYEYTLHAINSYADTGCKLYITAGSQAEYGITSGPIKETEQANPNTEYGQYKFELFCYLKEYCENSDCRVVEPRFFSLYGPRDYEKTMIMSTLRKMLRDEACDFTEAIQMWDYLYIDDAIEGLIRLIYDKDADGAYNFASGDCRPLRDYILEMKDVLGSNSVLRFGIIPYPKTGMVSIIADNNRLLNTGWRPSTSFADGIRIISDYEKD